ncbi:MAG: M23 family metallopeptidase [Candidatus Cloacimonetes bacterium]|nr:M23 family metallopeptidase [Candidatus Cloacimonadota bacterium]MDD4156672.1 M23 family metallopeptidase [Candidatus Cloacimonadota bacterium]
MSVKRKWYITLMQTDSSKMVNLSISKNIGHFVSAFILLLIIVLGISSFYVWKKNVELAHLNRLEKENQLLREKIAFVSTQMDSVLIRIKVMEEWEDNLRGERRLKAINPDIRALGSGGEPHSDPSFLPFDDNLHRIYNEYLNKLNFIKSKTTLTYETHSDLISSLEKRESLFMSTPSIIPTYGMITTDYGYRIHPIFRYKQFHAGIDIANSIGTPIYATADGKISFAGTSGHNGKLIRINHESGYQTRYAHLSKILVKKDEEVLKGQIIALMGSTGVSTGSHLHYEVYSLIKNRCVNPKGFFNLQEDQIKIAQNTNNFTRM